jgi:hypothetical protein
VLRHKHLIHLQVHNQNEASMIISSDPS